MDRTLAEFLSRRPPLEARLRVAHGLARAVEALHGRGRVHGALSPGSVLVADEAGDAVVLAPSPPSSSPLALAGWAAPEIVRGARPSRSADAFAVGALAQLALTGRGPFEGGEALETTRRVLFEEPRAARLDEPALPLDADAALARLLDRRARRRASPVELSRALAACGGEGQGERGTTPCRPLSPTLSPGWRRGRGRIVDITRISTWIADAAQRRLPALATRLPRSPLRRGALAGAVLVLLALALGTGPDASLARDVAAALRRGDTAAARAHLDAPPRGASRALVEKLRGDVACARRAPAECLRRYRTALAARPSLREDPGLRRNVRALLRTDEACATRRSAALLAGELRDPEALPALEAARRTAGIFSFLCTGDSIDRAIAATRSAGR